MRNSAKSRSDVNRRSLTRKVRSQKAHTASSGMANIRSAVRHVAKDTPRQLDVSIEMGGRQREVGVISGNSAYDAVFCYSPDYLNSPSAMAISISLPLQEDPFDPERTRSFFEGLLPEGFLRRTVAANNRKDAGDYLPLIEMLGSECLGAIQIKGGEYRNIEPEYRELGHDVLVRLAAEGALKSADIVAQSHLSLTGASGKIGAYRSVDGAWYLPSGSAPSTHIIKQSHIRYDRIVLNEQLAMMTAGNSGISVPESEILRIDDGLSDAKVLFASKRFDRSMQGSVRTISGLACPLRLHQEDFGQALGIPASAKYERPGEQQMKRMFDLLRRNSAKPIEDQMRLWDMIVFHWLIGNTDGHIKNFSLIYDSRLNSVRLAPAYDIVSTIVYETHSHDMAFSIGGETNWHKIRRENFARAAEEMGLSQRIFMSRFDDLEAKFAPALERAAAELEAAGYPQARELAEDILHKSRRGD